MALVFALAMKTTNWIKSRKAGAKAPHFEWIFRRAEALRFHPES
jgi:hypothetical protein